ncbi:E3 ubiquitin-protein ligase RING1 [Brachypodium distachyon]|uniref:RING-type domain-containing protein n=1 Tax=Brachypodium distachyon TaxID=15368 RepID=I1GX52_BRADI|nr:E3 ubiquitin-protein ligase RING1 [Brachypodium distachyon]KQK17593.1 hypothetical protein BRADI_1g35540v3 [Brachypodium distachyon]|eukprot:XP_003563588.1 E3 ubiquitin-protein ligase RING1 [Brachypodium distachyon]
MAGFTDELFLDIDEDGPGVLGSASYFSISETFEEEPQYTHSTVSPDFDMETLTPSPVHGSPFSFESDHDLRGLSPPRSQPFWDCLEDELADEMDALEWEQIIDAAASATDAAPGGGGAGGTGTGGVPGGRIGADADADVFGFISERDILGVMDGIDSGDESIFSDESPFDFGDDGPELDNVFQSVGWEVLPVPLDEDFEVLPGHMVDVAAGGAPPAARAAVERLQVVAIRGEDAKQGCAVCKEGITRGEFVTRLPCAHFYHGPCIGPWLAIRNSCPVCRYELPTDDPEYEQRRVRRRSAGGSTPQLGTPMQI